MEEIVKERIKENEKLFTQKELTKIKKNNILIQKIYILGLINGRNIYGKNLQ